MYIHYMRVADKLYRNIDKREKLNKEWIYVTIYFNLHYFLCARHQFCFDVCTTGSGIRRIYFNGYKLKCIQIILQIVMSLT